MPPADLRRLRDLTRYRADLVEVRTAEKNRVEKLLEDACLKLSVVASDTTVGRARNRPAMPRKEVAFRFDLIQPRSRPSVALSLATKADVRGRQLFREPR